MKSITTANTKMTLAVDGIDTKQYVRGIRCFVVYLVGVRTLIPVKGHPKKLGYEFSKATVEEATFGQSVARQMIKADTLPKELEGYVDLKTNFRSPGE